MFLNLINFTCVSPENIFGIFFWIYLSPPPRLPTFFRKNMGQIRICPRPLNFSVQSCIRCTKVNIYASIIVFFRKAFREFVINLVPRVFRKDPGISWSCVSSKIDRPRGCGESIKLQRVKNINFANYYQYKVQNTC